MSRVLEVVKLVIKEAMAVSIEAVVLVFLALDTWVGAVGTARLAAWSWKKVRIVFLIAFVSSGETSSTLPILTLMVTPRRLLAIG